MGMHPRGRAPHLSWEPPGLRSHSASPDNWGCGPAAVPHPGVGAGELMGTGPLGTADERGRALRAAQSLAGRSGGAGLSRIGASPAGGSPTLPPVAAPGGGHGGSHAPTRGRGRSQAGVAALATAAEARL